MSLRSAQHGSLDVLLLLSVFLLFGQSCIGGRDGVRPDDDSDASIDIDNSSQADALQDAVALPERQLVQLTDGNGECLGAANWNVSALDSDSRASTLDPSFRWCLYEWAGTGKPDVKGLKDKLGDQVEDIGPDLAVVESAGEPEWKNALYTNFKAAFEARTGILDLNNLAAEKVTVRLTVLDTSSTAEDSRALTVDADAWHGHALLNLAHNFLCVRATRICPVAIRSRLAMPYKYGELQPRGFKGGSGSAGSKIGTLADLTRAIQLELADLRKGSGQRLILNLSLGISPIYAESQTAGMKALKHALLLARCQGVGVYAAAGNLGSRSQGSGLGLVYPAAWVTEEVTAPDCAIAMTVLSESQQADLNSMQDFPLVQAVGGVGLDGKDLNVARTDARPPVLAVGEDAVTTDTTGALLDPMTGTSASTLVVAASAAALWANNHALTAWDLEKALLNSATKTTWTPDASFGSPVLQSLGVRVVDICSGKTAVSSPYRCDTEAQRHVVFVLSDAMEAAATTLPMTSINYENSPSTTCPGVQEYCLLGVGSCAGACWPETQYSSLEAPGVLPQPPNPRCPRCVLSQEALQLHLVVQPLTGFPELQLEVTMSTGSGSVTERYPITLSSTTLEHIVLDPPATSLTNTNAVVSSRLIGNNSNGTSSITPITIAH